MKKNTEIILISIVIGILLLQACKFKLELYTNETETSSDAGWFATMWLKFIGLFKSSSSDDEEDSEAVAEEETFKVNTRKIEAFTGFKGNRLTGCSIEKFSNEDINVLYNKRDVLKQEMEELEQKKDALESDQSMPASQLQEEIANLEAKITDYERARDEVKNEIEEAVQDEAGACSQQNCGNQRNKFGVRKWQMAGASSQQDCNNKRQACQDWIDAPDSRPDSFDSPFALLACSTQKCSENKWQMTGASSKQDCKDKRQACLDELNSNSESFSNSDGFVQSYDGISFKNKGLTGAKFERFSNKKDLVNRITKLQTKLKTLKKKV